MKLILVILTLFGTTELYAQSKSSHYKSKARGHFTHGSQASGKTVKNRSINIWTEGHLQSSSYAQNKTFIGVAKDTSPSSVPTVMVDNKDLMVYPNPFTENITISTLNSTKIDNIAIYDVTGRLVKNLSDCGTVCEVNLTNISSGSYYIRVTSGVNNMTKKLIKN